MERVALLPLKIAISAARLEHVMRGVETWARDTFECLRDRGLDVTLYKGSGAAGPCERVLHSTKKGSLLSRLLVAAMPGFCWRLGLGSGDSLEEMTFAWALLRELRRERFDIVHMQDAHVANWLRRAGERGLHSARVILGHGTEESFEFLRRFRYIQHLAPWHLQQALAAVAAGGGVAGRMSQVEGGSGGVGCRGSEGEGEQGEGMGGEFPFWVALPNFVDVDVFRPARDAAERASCREPFGVPGDAFVVGTVAAVKRDHKRIDYLIREFARFAGGVGRRGVESRRSQVEGGCWGVEGRTSQVEGGEEGRGELPPLTSDLGPSTFDSSASAFPLGRSTFDLRLATPHLLIAGARTGETDELVRLAAELLPGQIHIHTDLPREAMPRFCRALNVFTLTSLFEMMPIAVLEALASGLPLVVNRHPVLEWMVGVSGDDAEQEGGACIDMSAPGALAGFLADVTPEWIADHGRCARHRAEQAFSTEVVVEQYEAYYRRVVGQAAG